MGMATSGTLPKQPAPLPRADHTGFAGSENRYAPGRTLIRALEAGDLPAVSALVRATLAVGPPATEPALAAFLRRTLLEQPWADTEVPSLVAVDSAGSVVGFVAAELRRMRLGDRALRFVWAGHSAVTPAARRGAAGFLLMRKLLEGPQDATLGDSASPLMEQMWMRLGGRRLELKGIHWVRVFRPASVAARLVAPRRPRLQAGIRLLTRRLDDAAASAARPLIAPPRSAAAVEALTPRGLLAAAPTVTGAATLRVDYDEAFLEWLFAELSRVRARGQLVGKLVKNARGRALGWYLYLLRPGWRSEVLQVAASSERALGAVLDDLLAHAYEHGSAAVRGRLEPGMLEAIAHRRCLLWHRGAAVAHARDSRVLAAIESPDALVSRLDGDPWTDTLVEAKP
jgi:hypothetical protein